MRSSAAAPWLENLARVVSLVGNESLLLQSLETELAQECSIFLHGRWDHGIKRQAWVSVLTVIALILFNILDAILPLVCVDLLSQPFEIFFCRSDHASVANVHPISRSTVVGRHEAV